MRRQIQASLLATALLVGTAAAAFAEVSDADRKFIEQVAMDGHEEVSSGETAAKSDNSAVAAFGRQMVSDHTKMNDELATIAKDSGCDAARQPQPDPAGQGSGDQHPARRHLRPDVRRSAARRVTRRRWGYCKASPAPATTQCSWPLRRSISRSLSSTSRSWRSWSSKLLRSELTTRRALRRGPSCRGPSSPQARGLPCGNLPRTDAARHRRLGVAAPSYDGRRVCARGTRGRDP